MNYCASRIMNRFGWSFLVVLITGNVWGQSQSQSTAPKIQAAYLHHFTRFIKWPVKLPSQTSGQFVICILGKNTFGQYLKPLGKRRVNGQSIVIHYPNNVKHAPHCSILFITKSKSGNLSNILRTVSEKPVLTVSAIPNFIEQGGMIGFVKIDQRIRIKINVSAARDADLVINAKLLEVSIKVIGRVVKGGEQ